MNDLVINEEINIEDMIYELRGKQVMLDSDLAKLYQCKNGTKEINQAVNRNLEKFPERYSWKLTDNESENFLVTICDQKNNVDTRGGKYKNPRVFTEEGVAMLATILHTSVATKVSIGIMDAFVKMRKYIASNLIEQKYYKNMLLEDHENIKLLQESFNKIEEKQKVNTLFFEGQIYDAYSLLIEILDNAKEEIIIIDNYAGKELLNILKDINKKIIIVSSNINDTLIKKYTSQYKNIEFIRNDLFHDRFIIIDRKILYNCGSSFKDLGKKCFGIHLMEDEEYLKTILDKIEGDYNE